MVSSVIHLANKDYAALVDDFVALEILPEDCDRAKVIPLMDKVSLAARAAPPHPPRSAAAMFSQRLNLANVSQALSPYIKGGGAKKYEEELKKYPPPCLLLLRAFLAVRFPCRWSACFCLPGINS